MKKILAIALGALLVCSFALGGCKKKEPPVDTSYRYDDYYEGIDLDSRVGWFARGGSSEYAIVVPEQATEAERQAAAELQSYASRTAGAYVPVVTDAGLTLDGKNAHFSVGRTKLLEQAALGTDYASLNYDGFVIKTVGKTVVTDAANDRGFLYAVYDFIERIMNVRWFAPDETYAPRAERIPVYEMDVKSVPAFNMRTYLNQDTITVSSEFEFAAHSRVNGGWISLPEKFGGKSQFTGRHNGSHNARTYVPEEAYLTSHPEFYMTSGNDSIDWTNGILDDGAINLDMDGDGTPNEVYEDEEGYLRGDDVNVPLIVVHEMKKDVLANPEAAYFSFEHEDGMTTIPGGNPMQTAKYNSAGVAIRLTNAVARELQKWADAELNGREINLVMFAYGPTTTTLPVTRGEEGWAPVDDTVRCAENVVVRYCLVSPNVYYSPWDEEKHEAGALDAFDKWDAVCDEFMFWLYDANFHDYLAYHPNLQTLQPQIKGAAEHTQSYTMINGCYNTYEWQAQLRGYVGNKLLWNPDQDPTRLIDEYLNGYYGNAAAPYVKEMMDFFDGYYAVFFRENPEVKLQGTNILEDYQAANNLDESLLSHAWGIIQRAKAAVEADPNLNSARKATLLKRLTAVELTPKWMYFEYYQENNPFAEAGQVTAIALEFFEMAAEAGVKNYAELGPLSELKKGYGIV